MKRYVYIYETIIRFSSYITRHAFKIRCMPCNNPFQETVRSSMQLLPCNNLRFDTDSFGNNIQYGEKIESHDLFVFISEGEVCMSNYRIPDCHIAAMYYLPSNFTQCSAAMYQFIQSVHLSGSDKERALQLSQALYMVIDYQSGVTQTTTTAMQAFALRKGVCQDYAHMLIALCRASGIAARYANGFMVGEGETHAWVEVFDTDAWVGIDPTNNTVIAYGYIKIAHGRDAADCPINRGIYTGSADQKTDIKVTVKEI